MAPAPHRGDVVARPRELICPAPSYGHHRLRRQAKFRWQRMLLASSTCCGSGGAPAGSSWMELSDDGGQAPGGRRLCGGESQGRSIGHGPDLGLDGPGRAMVIPVPTAFDSSLMVTHTGFLGSSGITRSPRLQSRAWWWWPTFSSELVGQSNKGGGPRVTLALRRRSACCMLLLI
jgi:hypothetical protein